MENKGKGLVIVNTGDGKGKTTAAIGQVIRGLGNGLRVCVIQFLKSPDFKTGESEMLKKLEVEHYAVGAGFTNTGDEKFHKEKIVEALNLTKEKINSNNYDLIVLDEIINVFDISDFSVDAVITDVVLIDILKSRNEDLTVVLTGRNASKKLIDFADLVTDMTMVKHYYNNGVKAIKGIEY